MIDILSLGEPLVEFNNRGGEAYVKGFGGDTSNVAIAAARQGATTGMLTHIGTDAFGDDLMALWRGEGVSAETVKRDPKAPTGIYFVDHGPEGHTFSYRRAGSAASLVGPEDVPFDALGKARMLHASGISLAISPSACDATFAAMRAAREKGVTVSFDLNLRKLLWPIDRAERLARGTRVQHGRVGRHHEEIVGDEDDPRGGAAAHGGDEGRVFAPFRHAVEGVAAETRGSRVVHRGKLHHGEPISADRVRREAPRATKRTTAAPHGGQAR